MKTLNGLADFDYPLVVEKAQQITTGMTDDRSMLEKRYLYPLLDYDFGS